MFFCNLLVRQATTEPEAPESFTRCKRFFFDKSKILVNQPRPVVQPIQFLGIVRET